MPPRDDAERRAGRKGPDGELEVIRTDIENLERLYVALRAKSPDDREAEGHIDPPPKQQLAILWRERQWRRMRRELFLSRFKIVGYWITGGAGLAAIISTIMGHWPWKK